MFPSGWKLLGPAFSAPPCTPCPGEGPAPQHPSSSSPGLLRAAGRCVVGGGAWLQPQRLLPACSGVTTGGRFLPRSLSMGWLLRVAVETAVASASLISEGDIGDPRVLAVPLLLSTLTFYQTG